MPWFTLLVLALAAYRLTRLIVKDDFPPVLWMRDRLVGGWRPLTPKEQTSLLLPSDWDGSSYKTPRGFVLQERGVTKVYVHRRSWVPYWLAELLGCPWCVSAYVSGALTGATDAVSGVPRPWLVAVAVWALSALLASREWA